MLIQYTIRSLVFALGLLASVSAFAAAVIETASGQVRAGPTALTATAVTVGQRIQAGSTVVTGPKAQATLRFDDGQYVLLHEHTEFRVAAYSYTKGAPANDRFGFELLRGVMRMVTAAVKPLNPRAYSVRTPQAAIGIRGTDFMLAVVNPLYISVLGGTVQAANAAGTVGFAAGSTGFVANAAVLAATISAAALPVAVATAFKQLGAIAVNAAGAVGATQAAAGGITPTAALVGAAIAVGIGAALSDDDDVVTGTTAPTGTLP